MTSRQQVPVFVRVRPLNTREKNNGATDAWALGESSLACKVQGKDTASRFRVNKVFGIESKTEEVFTKSAKEIIAHAIQGWSGTVFAYGQTSSGKTHTMMGSGDEAGIVQLSMNYMWHEIEKDTEADYIVRCTSMEVYNEKLTDLKSGLELEIKEGRNNEPLLKGEAPVVVSSAEHAILEISSAMNNRHLGKTAMNDQSSRSHTIFRIQIDRIPKATKSATRSLLHLVDLAGSESIKKTGTAGAAAREGSNINQSLSALVRVIKCLTESKNPGYVPFRDSKLTRLLKTSLGGNTKTSIICCVTGASDQYDQTVSTLRFAQEASKVKNDPKRCVLAAGEIPPALRKTVQAMAAAQTAEAKEEYRKELDKVISEMEVMKEATAMHAKMLEDEREKRRAAEAALFKKEKTGPRQLSRRQTMCGMGIGNLNWSPVKERKISFEEDVPMGMSSPAPAPPVRTSMGLPPPGRLSAPAQSRPSIGLRKDLEDMKRELQSKNEKLVEREQEIECTIGLMRTKEAELEEKEAIRRELSERMEAVEMQYKEERDLLEERLLEACELAQATMAEKDRAKEKIEEDLHNERQLKLDAEMAKHRLAHELSEMQKDVTALKARNMSLTSAEKERALLQEKTAALMLKNEEMVKAQHILDTASAREWQASWNKEKQEEEINEMKGSLEKELQGMKTDADTLRSEIEEIKERHASQVDQLKEEQAQREQDYESRTEEFREKHKAEIANLEKNAMLEAAKLDKEKTSMQEAFEKQIEAERQQAASIQKDMTASIEQLRDSSEIEAGLRQVKYEEETAALRTKLEMEVNEYEGKMHALKNEVVQATTLANDEIAFLKKQHEELMQHARAEAEKEAAHLEQLARDTKSQATQDINRVKREACEERDKILKREQEKVEALQDKLSEAKQCYDAEVSRLEEEAAKAEAELKTEAEQRVATLDAEHRKRMDETTELFGQQKREYDSKFSHLQKIQANHEEQVLEEKKVMAERFERKEHQLLETLEEEKQHFETNRASLQRMMETKISAILQRAEAEHAELRTKALDSQKHIEEVERRKEEEMVKLQMNLAQQESDLANKEKTLKGQLEGKMSALIAERDYSIQQVESRLTNELASITSEREALNAQLKREQDEHQSNVAVLMQQRDELVQSERQASEALQQEMQLRAEEEKAQLTAAFDEQNHNHKEEMHVLTNRFNEERHQLEQAKHAEMANLKHSYEANLAEVEREREKQREEFQKKAHELEEARIKEVGIARSEVEAERAKHEETVKELNMIISKAHCEKEEAVAEIKAQCDKEQKEVEARFEEELEAKEEAVARLEAEKQEELEKVRAEFDDVQDEAEKTQRLLKEDLKNNLAKAALEFSASKSALEAEIGSLQGDVEKQQQAHAMISKQHEGQVKLLETQYQEALESERQKAEENQRDILERKLLLEEETQRLGDLTKQQQEELDCSMMGPMREARNALEKQLTTKKAHLSEAKEEIQKLRKQLRLAEADKEQLKNKLQYGGARPKAAPKPAGKATKTVNPDGEKLKAKIKKMEETQKAREEEAHKLMEEAKDVINGRDKQIHELIDKIAGLEAENEARTQQATQEVNEVIKMGRQSISNVAAQAEEQMQLQKEGYERTIKELQQQLASTQVEEKLQKQKKTYEDIIRGLQREVLAAQNKPAVVKESTAQLRVLQDEKEELTERLSHAQSRFQKAQMEKQAALTEKEALQDQFEEKLQKEKRILRKQYRHAMQKEQLSETPSRTAVVHP